MFLLPLTEVSKPLDTAVMLERLAKAVVCSSLVSWSRLHNHILIFLLVPVLKDTILSYLKILPGSPTLIEMFSFFYVGGFQQNKTFQNTNLACD